MCFVVPIAEFPKRQKKHSFFGNLAGEGVFFMLLNDVREEFAFHCQCRNLSPRTIKNYGKQIDYLIRFLQGKGIEHVQDVEPRYIKAFLLEMKQTGHTPNYINDLLKACLLYTSPGRGPYSPCGPWYLALPAVILLPHQADGLGNEFPLLPGEGAVGLYQRFFFLTNVHRRFRFIGQTQQIIGTNMKIVCNAHNDSTGHFVFLR